MTLKFHLGQDFLTMHISTEFHHPEFNRSELIVLTNKQANKQVDIALNIHLASICFTPVENCDSDKLKHAAGTSLTSQMQEDADITLLPKMSHKFL